VQNLNQQSDSSDFLGGFKPVDLRSVCVPLMNTFGRLFPRTFSRANNADFINRVRSAFEKQEWPVLVRLLLQSLASARAKLEQPAVEDVEASVQPESGPTRPSHSRPSHS
jgi:midasin